jgi:hypothetical protein
MKFESNDIVINKNNGRKGVIIGRQIISDEIKYLIRYDHPYGTEWVFENDLRFYRKG